MGERREITRRSDRAAARNDRRDPAIEARKEQLDGLGACSRVPLGERVRTQEHRRPDDLGRVGLPDSARMAPEEPELELVGELRGDRLRDEATEPRVDSVRVLAASGARDPLDELAGRAQLPAPFLAELRVASLDRNRPDVCQRQIVTGQGNCSPERHEASLVSGYGPAKGTRPQ